MSKQRSMIPKDAPQVQRVDPILSPYEVYVLVRTKPYGSEGTEPVDLAECPYFQQYHTQTSCVSGSGGSMCGGFRGGSADGVKCGWLPRWTVPTQRLVVEPRRPEDDPDPRRRQAGRN